MGENPFTLNRYLRNPCILNGDNGKNGFQKLAFENYPCGYFGSDVNHLPQNIPYQDTTQGIMNTHPGQSPASLPNFLYELKDLPGMLQHAARRARLFHRAVRQRKLPRYGKRDLGEDYLNYIFGWKPFFMDLESMIGLSDFLEHRSKKFKSIRGSELRTTGKLGSDTANNNGIPITIQSYGTLIGGTSSITTSRERWFSAKWRVDPIRFGQPLYDGRRAALRDLLGLDPQTAPLQVWEALPWSWFVDWSFNVGAILKAQANIQGVKFLSACVMDSAITEEDVTAKGTQKFLSVSNGSRTRETKMRTPFYPTIVKQNAGFNIFEPGHLATIASLQVTQARGSSSF
jgi:hypothetical protein